MTAEHNSVLRVHRHARDFTLLGNATIRDRRLSLRASGLLHLLLSFPDGSPVNALDLAREGKEAGAACQVCEGGCSFHEGRDAIRTAFDELLAHRYAKRERKQVEGGRWVTVTHVFEVPYDPADAGFPGVGETPSSEDISPGHAGDWFSGAGGPGANTQRRGQKDNTSDGPDGAAGEEVRPEIDHLCQLLAQLIIRNGGSEATYRTRGTSKTWRNDMRLLVDRDKRPPHLVERAIRWAQGHTFYRTIILSPAKLREHYHAMQLRAAGEGGPPVREDPDRVEAERRRRQQAAEEYERGRQAATTPPDRDRLYAAARGWVPDDEEAMAGER